MRTMAFSLPLVLGCRQPSALRSFDAGTADGGTAASGGLGAVPGDAGPWLRGEAADSGPPRPGVLPFAVRAHGADAGSMILGGGEPVPVDATFEVELPFRALGLRVRLIDPSGRAVATGDQLELTKGTVYRLSPEEPLTPGTSYEFDLGPNAASAAITDEFGHPFADGRLGFVTEGERPSPRPPKGARRRRGR